MKSFLVTTVPKRTLSIRAVRAANQGPMCCLSTLSGTPTSFRQNDPTCISPRMQSEHRRAYSVMGRDSSFASTSSWVPQGKLLTFPHWGGGVSLRTNTTDSDETNKTKTEEEKVDEDAMETLPPPIPGDNGGDDEDFEFEDPNEAKHDPSDLDGDRDNFTVPIVINMPDMDDESSSSTIEKWYKEPGDIIKRNDILCDIATPDFTFGMVTEDNFDAIMGEHHVAEGESAEDNAPICTIYHQPEPGTSSE